MVPVAEPLSIAKVGETSPPETVVAEPMRDGPRLSATVAGVGLASGSSATAFSEPFLAFSDFFDSSAETLAVFAGSAAEFDNAPEFAWELLAAGVALT